MSLPTEMKALVFPNKGQATVRSIPLPELRPTYLLVKITAVALNPTDWKSIDAADGASPFSIVGCDYAGTVLQIGSEVTKSFSIGDRVYGCAHGSNPCQAYDGVFAEYAVVKGDVTMHSPPSGSGLELTDEDLATIALGSITVGQGLFQQNKGLGLAMPESGKGNGEWLLIYGGSTATGSLGIQFAKLAGYKVIATCSPKNFAFVKGRGADEVFDYHDPGCGAKIRELTGDKLRFAWDTIGWSKEKGTNNVCDAALSSDSSIAHYGSILFGDFERKEVKQTVTLMYTMFGEGFVKYGMEFPVSEDDYGFAKVWMGLTEKLVREGKVKPHPKRVGEGGLEGILGGLKDLKEDKVSGQKLVYRVGN